MFEKKLTVMMIPYVIIFSVMAMFGEGFNPENAVLGEFITEEERKLPHFGHKRTNAERSESSQNPSNVCRTSGCLKAAEEIASSLDQNVDPCDDFYQFSCGGWKDKHQITEDRPGVLVLSELQDETDSKIKDLLEKDVAESDPDYVRKAKQIYHSCMDLESIESVGSEPLKKALETLRGWPVVEGESWEGENFDWIDALILMRQMGYDHNILLGLYVFPDSLNSTQPIITFDQTSLGVDDPSYLMADDVTAAYKRLMVQSAEKLGADPHNAEPQMTDALNFEIALAKILVSKEERRNVSQEYNRYTVKTLKEEVPQIDWMKYFNGLLMNPISEEEPLVIVDPDFVFKLVELLSQTDKRVVANYMVWRVAQQTLPALSKDWLSLVEQFTSDLSGEVHGKKRDERCLYNLAKYMSVALSNLFVTNYFQDESKQGASEIVDYIQKEFINTFDNIQWMPQETRRYAKEKINALKKFVGYPKELLNNKLVSDLFKELIVADGGYYDNFMKLKKWKIDEDLSQLRHPYLLGRWKDHAEVDMAFPRHDLIENSIDMPAALLMNPFFDMNRPQYLNFGAVGNWIGKKISRVIDHEGRQYDKFGNNVNWWDAETTHQFEKKMECLIKQYSNYTTEKGLKVDGVLTLETNVEDNAGLKEAYKAYQTWVKDHGTEGLLPELNYSPNQLFWISAAATSCAKTRLEFEEQLMLLYRLSPFEISVIGSISNLPEFANDFQCGVNAKMNPQNKCQIWV